jgi:predicted transcriptional regulator
MPNRNRTEIIVEMLEALASPVPITWVMYRTRLSYSQLKEYREFLLAKGLARQENNLWSITTKGKSFLEAYKRAMKILGES